MVATNRVIWSEGMFIRPQHFQQQERYWYSQLRCQPNSLAPFHYGFREYQLNLDLLDQGKIALQKAQGVFPDGTVFSLPQQDCMPAPLQIPEGVSKTKVYLCVPIQQGDALEVAYEKDPLLRYRAAIESVADSASQQNGDLAEIELGRLQLRLLLEDDDRSEYTCLQMLEIKDVRPDKKIILQDQFIPALLEIQAEPRLVQFINEVHGLLQHRADILAHRLTNTQQSESAVVADFMLLQLVNRYESIFRQMMTSSNLHPQPLFEMACHLMAEIATYTKDSRRPGVQPNYQHENLADAFLPVMKELRHCLSMVLEQHAVAISLVHQNYGVYVGQVQDKTLFENSVMVLAVYADKNPEELRKNFAMQAKIGALENIRDLVSRGIPGVPLVPLPIAPRQIPYHANFAYFRIDQRHELWKQIMNTGSIALHVSGQYPQLRLELWAIRG